MNAPVIRMESRQSQTLTPRLQQAVRLLQLSSLDFAQEIRDAMGKNPFLEYDEATEAGADGLLAASMTEDPSKSDNASQSVDAHSTPTPPPEGDSDAGWERDSWHNAGGSGRGFSGDSDTSVIDLVVAETDLRQHLHGQANLRSLSDRDRALVGCVIESLDDDGYLRTDLRELACLAELDPEVDDAELSMAIKLVQSMEPSGVAARTIGECLQLQIHLIEDATQRALASDIVTQHLEKLAHKDCTGLAKLLNKDLKEVEAVCERIRHMDPRPGWRYGGGHAQYVVPDVIAKKVKGKWLAMLNPAVVPRIKLNQVYADLFRQHRDGQHTELVTHLQEARWTVRNVEQRFATILAVANEILVRQHHFLEFGPLAMKPLGLKEIAEKVGLHESTVSRVTNNKYMATPSGVFELKFFFSRAMPTVNGGACSATAIRGLIKDMIEAEDESKPLSDAEIARQLARQGLTVARRTVTKYRQQLKVPAVELRRCHA